MQKIIECTCGFVIKAEDDDELVRMVNQHGRQAHEWPELSREEALALATPVQKE